MSGPRRGSRSTSERPVRPRGTAKDRALRLLGVRDRSRREVERRLLQAGFEQEEIDAALADLAAAGLIDDERFAGAVVEHAERGRLAGKRAVMGALLAKGVSRQTAEEATERLAASEEARADELAAGRAERLRGLDPAVAFRRLSGLLIRRGFPPGLAFSAARKALDEPSDED